MQIQQQRFQMEVQNWLRCVVRAQHQQAYPKRRIDMKRDLQKRPTKETFFIMRHPPVLDALARTDIGKLRANKLHIIYDKRHANKIYLAHYV
jgi:hypothetical protein